MDFLGDNLPQLEHLAKLYQFTSHPAVSFAYRAFLFTQSTFFRYIFPSLYPVYVILNKTLKSVSSDSPDIASLLALGVALLISLRMLNYMRRTIVYWINLLVQLSFWVVVVAGGLYVYQRGLANALEDFKFIWNMIETMTAQGEQVGAKRARGKEAEARRVKRSGRTGF